MSGGGRPGAPATIRARAAGIALSAALWAAAALAAAGPAPDPATSPACRLRDVAHSVGLDFVHDRGTSPERHLAETMGAGVAWLDYDGDGWEDLYVVQSGHFPPDGGERSANHLYRNLGPDPRQGAEGAIRFEDVTETAGVGDRGYGQGVTAADVDGDGYPDLYVTNYGPDVFYRNRGDGTFENATSAAGLGLDGWSSSAAFADADGDGDLDLYVSRYVVYPPGQNLFCRDQATGAARYCDPAMFDGATDRFYKNRGDGTFEDATAAAGLAGAAGRGLGVLFTDLDGDGDPDLYVANDETLNFLFENRGDGTFEDLSLLSGTAVNMNGKPEAGMGVVAADFDGDGDPDLAVTNFDVETNSYYENLGGLQFADRSAPSGFGVPSFNLLGFGMITADLDGDGDLDVYTTNGHIYERPRRPDTAFAQRDLILLGDGHGHFRELRCPVLERSPHVGRGLAQADFDRDGDPDLALLNNDGPLQLLKSDLPGLAGGGLTVRLHGVGADREAIGARVTLVTSKGAKGVGAGAEIRRTRWITAGDSYQSSSDKEVVFAVPPDERVRAVEVAWPRGSKGGTERIESPPPGRELEIYP